MGKKNKNNRHISKDNKGEKFFKHEFSPIKNPW